MTGPQWDAIAALLDEGWKGDFTDEKMEVYRVLLDDYEFEQVLVALKKLVRSGQPFLPAASEIAAAIEDDPTWPSWTECWAALDPALSMDDDRAWATLSAVHPVLSAFVEREGLQRLRMLPLRDDVYGELRVAELRQRWDEFSERVQVRLRSGMELEAAVGRPRIERGGGLRQLDPGAAL